MTQDTAAMHHLHKRKRIHDKNELYPHSNKFKRFMDKIIFIVGIVGPGLTIPQIIKIFSMQSAAGVSLITWLGYLIASIFWIIYGILHKDKPIIVTYCMNIIVNLGVVIGTIIYS